MTHGRARTAEERAGRERRRGSCPLSHARRDAQTSGAATPARSTALRLSSPAIVLFTTYALLNSSPLLLPLVPPGSPVLPLHLLCFSCSPPSRRQDGQGTQQPASRDEQAQLFLIELRVEEARTGRVAQPGLRLPGRPGWSRRRSRIRVGEQRESAAGAQSGRSAEQIHQSDPGLAEQVSTRTEFCRSGEGGRAVSYGFMLLFAPSTFHFASTSPYGGVGGVGRARSISFKPPSKPGNSASGVSGSAKRENTRPKRLQLPQGVGCSQEERGP